MAKITLKKIKKLPTPKAFAIDNMGMNFPTLYVDSGQMPEIKEWEVGKTYKVVVELKQKSKSEMSVAGSEQRIDARFDIVAYRYLEPKDIKDMTDEEFGEYQGEVMAGKEKL